MALLAAVLAACGAAPQRSPCAAGLKCLRAGNFAEPGSLDPARTFVKPEQTIANDLFLGLATFDAAGEPIPGMAESWTVSPDGLVWTFRLRAAQWSDGRPVTAQDFVYSLRRLADPKTASPYANFVYPFVAGRAVTEGKTPPEALGVEAPDARTVVIRLVHPVPYMTELVAHPSLLPVPPHVVARHGDAWTAPANFVGNGPFVLAEWRLGDRLTLRKNPRFYDAARVCLDRVDYFPTTDVVSAERQIRRGELDLNVGFAASRYRYLRADPQLRSYVRAHPWTDIFYVVFNQAQPPFGDPRVRQALSMAVDRDFIARSLMQSAADPADAYVPAGLGARPAAPDWARLPFSERQARARRLLAQAGYGPARPLQVELKYFTGWDRVGEAIQADWRAIGVDARLRVSDVAVFFDELHAGAFQAGLTDWYADYRDATNFLNLLRTGDPGGNYGDHADPAYDRMLAAAEAEPDRDRRAVLLQAAETRLLQAAPIAPLYVNLSRNLVNPRLTGWQANVADVHPKRWVCWR